ncbi:MAG TPA: hypothetical protein VGD95_03475 [Micavibrio sp.]
MAEFKTIAGADYHKHQGLWLPEDLQTGDIISCRMLTKYDGAEKAELCPRHVMVLGMEMDPATLEYTALHVARFSYTKSYVTDDSNFLIPRSYERMGLITGLTDRAVLKADRTDFLPLTQDHFWGDVHDVQRLGRVDARLFKEIRDTMERGHRVAAHSFSRYPGRNPDTWYVPGAHIAGDNVPAPHHQHSFTVLDDVDLARIQTDWALRKDPHKLDADYVIKCLAALENARIALARHENWLGRQRHKISVHEPFRHHAQWPAVDNQPPLATASEEPPAATNILRSPDEQLALLLPHANANSLNDLRALVSRFNEKAEAPFSKIEIPAHLWQGRYMMCKIHDLHDEDNDGTAYRPCAVWKAYKDRNTGELAGLELHPVTRGSPNSFRYRFQVYPLKTDSPRPGHLIADCIVRVPLTTRYFHEKNNQGFFELPPDKLEKFTERRAHALASGDPVHVYGLKDIPEEWEEVTLDPTPSFQQFIKWSAAGKIKFDGAVNDKARQRQRDARPY